MVAKQKKKERLIRNINKQEKRNKEKDFKLIVFIYLFIHSKK
jgi:hypothetical protein